VKEDRCVQGQIGGSLEDDDSPHEGNNDFGLQLHCYLKYRFILGSP